jgi:hypothetical protein
VMFVMKENVKKGCKLILYFIKNGRKPRFLRVTVQFRLWRPSIWDWMVTFVNCDLDHLFCCNVCEEWMKTSVYFFRIHTKLGYL